MLILIPAGFYKCWQDIYIYILITKQIPTNCISGKAQDDGFWKIIIDCCWNQNNWPIFNHYRWSEHHYTWPWYIDFDLLTINFEINLCVGMTRMSPPWILRRLIFFWLWWSFVEKPTHSLCQKLQIMGTCSFRGEDFWSFSPSETRIAYCQLKMKWRTFIETLATFIICVCEFSFYQLIK